MIWTAAPAGLMLSSRFRAAVSGRHAGKDGRHGLAEIDEEIAIVQEMASARRPDRDGTAPARRAVQDDSPGSTTR